MSLSHKIKVINRDWINNNSIFHDQYSSFNKEELCLHINFWKKFLIDLGATQGSKVGIATKNFEIYYIALTFACFELGLNLIVLAKPFRSEKDLSINPFFPLDLLLLDILHDDKPFYDYYINNSKKVILDLDTITPNLDVENINLNISPSDVCLSSVSSGTTSNPKKIQHTHEFFYDLCSVNWQSLDFREDDKVLHLYTFQHGSALSIHFLPSLYVCKDHYFFTQKHYTSDEEWDLFPMYCRDNNITKLQSPYTGFTDKLINSIKRSKEGCPNLTIHVLSFINPDWLTVVKEGKVKKIVSIFGCSETAGPLFLPYIDKETIDFDPTFLGQPIEEYYKIRLEQNNLIVFIPTYNIEINTEDFIEEQNGNWYFIGKNKTQRINDIEVNLKDIRIIAKSVLGDFQRDIIIIVDEIYNKLYIASDDDNLHLHKQKVNDAIKKFYNNQIELTDTFNLFDLELFTGGGIKPSRQKILNHIRQINNEQY